MIHRQTLTRWLINFVDPFLTVDPRVRKRLRQIDLETVRSALWLQVMVWPLIYVGHYHFNDQSKHPLLLYFKYRYGMAAAILAVGAVGCLLDKSSVGVRLSLTALAALLCYGQSWSMTLGPYISHSYLVWLPLIVLVSFSRSFAFSAFWLLFLISTSRYFWGPHTEIRFIFSDTSIGLLVLLGAHFGRRTWLNSHANQLLNDDLRKSLFAALEGKLLATRHLGYLASRVAHDIRSPASGLSMVVQKSKGLAPEEREIISSAILRIRSIAEELLLEYRSSEKHSLKSTKSSEPLALIQIKSLVETVLAEKTREFADKPRLTLHLTTDPQNEALRVRGNELSLVRALSNIINNADEAMASVGIVEVCLVASGSKILLSVSDSGKGIPGSVLNNIGKLGFTFDKTHGTGIGLSSAKATLESMGGEIVIDSTIGRGTTVTMVMLGAT